MQDAWAGRPACGIPHRAHQNLAAAERGSRHGEPGAGHRDCPTGLPAGLGDGSPTDSLERRQLARFPNQSLLDRIEEVQEILNKGPS